MPAISDTTPTVMFKIGDSRVDQLEVDPTIVGTVFEVDDITIQNDSGNSIVMTDVRDPPHDPCDAK